MPIPRIDLSSVDEQYRLDNDPPGMWTGYNASLPLREPRVYYPRAGIQRGMELGIDYDRSTGGYIQPVPLEEVKVLARRLAWERYVEAHAKASGEYIDGRDFIAAVPE